MSISAFSISEDSLDGRHFVVSIELSVENRVLHTHALIDCGASGYAFFDSSFAQRNSLPLTPLIRPRVLEVVDGQPAAAGMLTHLAKLKMNVNGHHEHGSFLVIQLGHYPVVLGVKWLQIHDPFVSWSRNTLTFSSSYCRLECLENKHVPLDIPGLSDLSDESPPPKSASSVRLDPLDIRENKVSHANPEFLKPTEFIEHPEPMIRVPSSRLEPPKISKYIEHSQPPRLVPEIKKSSALPIKICMIGAAPFSTLMKDRKNEIFTASLYEIEKAIQALKNPSNLSLAAASLDDVAKSLKPKRFIDPATVVPKDFHDLLDVFSKQEADKLPPHRSYDHMIVLMEGAVPSGPLYKMSAPELLVLQKYLKENLAKGFIRASSSPCSSPVLFARKPSGGLRFCVDYRALNAITVRIATQYP